MMMEAEMTKEKIFFFVFFFAVVKMKWIFFGVCLFVFVFFILIHHYCLYRYCPHSITHLLLLHYWLVFFWDFFFLVNANMTKVTWKWNEKKVERKYQWERVCVYCTRRQNRRIIFVEFRFLTMFFSIWMNDTHTHSLLR